MDVPVTTTVSITMPELLVGPPGAANGGWVSGTVAALLGSGPLGPAADRTADDRVRAEPVGIEPGVVEATLRAPTPVGVALRAEVGRNEARLFGPDPSGDLLVHARRAEEAPTPPPPVPIDVARRAANRFPGLVDHPFPGCVVCGVERPTGEGMFVHPGPVDPDADDGTVAAVWRVGGWLAGPDRTVPSAAVWGALDCPTGWVHIPTARAENAGAVALLGRLTVQVRGTVEVGREYVVVARSAGTEGRKTFADAAVYSPDGDLVGASRGLWIVIRPPTG